MSPNDQSHAQYDRALKRGAFFNLLGLLAKLVQPLFVVVVTWLWGPAVVGPYLLALAFMEILSGTIVAGYADAVTIYASRHIDAAPTDPEHRRALYGVLSNALLCTVTLSLAAAVLAQFSASFLVTRFFPDYQGLFPGLYLLLWALVPRSASQVAIAATKAAMRMEFDAMINGMAHPLVLLGVSALAYALGGGLGSLCLAHLITETIVCALAVRALGGLFDLRALASAFTDFKVDRTLLRFAVPQSLNLTFNRYIARMDGIMLASFGLQAAMLGYFSTAALLTSNLNQIRLVFSGALAPVAARHYGSGDTRAVEVAMNQVARWATSLVVPAVLVCVVLRDDVMRLISHSYGDHSTFIVLLLIPPFTSCAYGIAGSCLFYAGHSRVTLINSSLVALLNTGFNFVMIPRYGMLGAAIATALATSLTTALQMIELWWIEGVCIRWSAVWKPHVGFALGAAVLALLWDPAHHSAWVRAATVAGLLVGYVALMLALGHEELTALLQRRSRSA
ncbi:MAG TPA: polysaccharide biosynthesis C-terminal domain-containing protein [Polyangiales bacterium]